MNQTTVLCAVIGFLAACGPSIDVEVDRGRPLTSLSTSEVVDVCDAVVEYERASLSDRDLCNLLQWAYYDPQAGESYVEEVCDFVNEACENEDLWESSPGLGRCALPAYHQLEFCTATIEEYLACVETIVEQRQVRADAFECKPKQETPRYEASAACQILSNRCRPAGSRVVQ